MVPGSLLLLEPRKGATVVKSFTSSLTLVVYWLFGIANIYPTFTGKPRWQPSLYL